MNAIQYLLLSMGIFLVGAMLSLLFAGAPRAARQITGWFGMLGAIAGVISVIAAALASRTPSITLFEISSFGDFGFRMDPLSILLVAVITIISAVTSFYSLGQKSLPGWLGFFTNIFIATMLAVVTVNNAFFFLVFWEIMTLASYFLVIWNSKNPHNVRTGYIYMVVAHAGAALIMAGFFILFQAAGSFDFKDIRSAILSPGLRSLVFLLAFIGFGAKAGMVPLHFWTPDTYAAAPDHISALMSSVMKKTAVYGIIRVCIDLLGMPIWWWGFVVLLFGGLSALFGAFYALSEQNVKRLLALSSVENVGIILVGIGLGMIGISNNQPLLAVVGLMAALYHLVNHAFFKSLLFLGNGAAAQAAATLDLNRMGGLGKRMPWTAVAVLVGALSVTAIPPFNGFMSEWFTYQGLLVGSQNASFAMRVASPLLAITLAIAGALAVMVYIKAYGSMFSGPPRTAQAAEAKEAPVITRISLGLLAIGCLVLGVGSPWITPWFSATAASIAHAPSISMAGRWMVYPGSEEQAVLSAPLLAILLISLLLVPLVIVAVLGGLRAGRRTNVLPWACGYDYTSQMAVTASSFNQQVKVTYSPFYWVRTLVEKPYAAISLAATRSLGWIRTVEPVIEQVVTRPTSRVVETAGQWIRALQMGDIRVYCLYIIITLTILLIGIFGRSGL